MHLHQPPTCDKNAERGVYTVRFSSQLESVDAGVVIDSASSNIDGACKFTSIRVRVIDGAGGFNVSTHVRRVNIDDAREFN
jgi:hypothetical protein